VKPIKNLLRWTNLVLVLATLPAFLSSVIDPNKIWHFSVLGLAYPFMLTGHVAFVIFWAVGRDRYVVFSLTCIFIGFVHFPGFFGWHFSNDSKTGKNEITVMTYNTAGLQGFGSDEVVTESQRLARLNSLAKEAGYPGVFCAQESKSDYTVDLLKAGLGFDHYYQSGGTVIFSKYPFVQQGAVSYGGASFGVWAGLKTPQGIVRVYSVHLQSNQMTHTANKIATEGDLREKQTWRDIRFVLARYKNSVQVRARQAQVLARHVAGSPHPVIVCGDFNDPPTSFVYHVLTENLQDSFREKGGGIGATFAGRLPALRIDYVLPAQNFKVKSYRIHRVELSDHFPVSVKLTR
jgi:endonuclease/exonuclease/phosphatase family metal-dependent hydrolase